MLPKRQSSLDVSDSDGPASLRPDSSQSQLPSGATLRGSWSAEDQKHCLLRLPHPCRRSAGEGSLVSGRPWESPLDQREPAPPGRQCWIQMLKGSLRKGGEQERESLVQCVQVNSVS